VAIQNWPSELPYPLQDGYVCQLPELNARSSFTLGARVRPLYQTGSENISATVALKAAQWSYMQAWHHYALKNGTEWFNVSLLVAGVVKTIEARFTAPLAFELAGSTNVQVRMSLETRTGTAMSQAEWDALNP